ncbi:MAG: VWA domain-containing protein, partial [Bacteroidota bacterium]
ADPANPNSSVVFGSLFGPTGKTYRIEMFRNSTPDENDNIADLLGNGEGEELVGWTETPVSVTEEEDGLGKFTRNAIYNFEIVTTQPLAGGDILSATATDEANNTSEFSTILYTGVITRIYGAMVAENDPHNRWVVNTTFLGIPLHWQDGIAEFSIGLNFPDHFKPQVNDVLSAWNAVQPVPLSFSLAQNLSPTDQWALTPDGKNNLVYAADEAEFVSKVGPGLENVLGITRVRYNSFTGEIFDADVLFNGGFNYQDNTSPTFPSDDPKRIDFKAVGVHELGHAGGGLSDIYNRNDAYYQLFMGAKPVVNNVTMYGIIEPDDTFQRTVHPDDEAGLAYIYGNVLPAHVDLMLVIDASQSFADPATYDAFDPSIDAAVELVDKLRVGDRIGVVKLSGGAPFVPAGLGFQEILPDPTPENDYDDVQNQKDEIKTAIALLPAETTDDRRAIGSALVTAASTFSTENVGRRGIILFSAGNETEAPSALDPVLVLPKLTGADPISVYTMGFAQSPDGANLGSKLADATSGAFYETDITTISPVVNQIWDNVTGYQLVLSRQAISWQGNRAISWQGSQNWNSAISWQGARDLAISWQENRAISWQGSVDKGTAAMFPAISWQGKA